MILSLSTWNAIPTRQETSLGEALGGSCWRPLELRFFPILSVLVLGPLPSIPRSPRPPPPACDLWTFRRGDPCFDSVILPNVGGLLLFKGQGCLPLSLMLRSLGTKAKKISSLPACPIPPLSTWWEASLTDEAGDGEREMCPHEGKKKDFNTSN